MALARAGSLDREEASHLLWGTAKRREVILEIQRHLARQSYVQLASAIRIAVWESPLKSYVPNVSDDDRGRVRAAWLDR